MPFLSGKNGGVLVGAATWKFNEWRLAIHTEAIPTTNFESQGFAENIDGINSGKITCRGPYDSAAMALTSGQSYAFTLGASASITWVVTARVTDITLTTNVERAVEVEVAADSTGSFTASIS